jgi:hypothetical protein
LIRWSGVIAQVMASTGELGKAGRFLHGGNSCVAGDRAGIMARRGGRREY